MESRRLTAAQRMTAEAWLPRAIGWAAAMGRRRPGLRDEYVSEAMLAACEMARDFRPLGGIPPAAYLEHKLRAAGSRVRAGRRPAGYKGHRPRGGPMPATGPLETPAGRVDVPAPPGPDVAAAEWAEALLRRLAAGPREAVRLTVLEGLTRDAAAARMGRSRRGVSLLRAAGLARLRAILAAGGDPR